MKRGRILSFALAAAMLGVIALLIFAGAFGRGVAVGAFGTILLAIAFFWFMQRLMRSSAETLAAPQLPVAAWDYELVATDLNGEPISFNGFRNRVIFMNLWATWCAPCIAEMPSLFRLQDRTRDADIVFVFLSLENVDVVRKFIARRDWSGPFHVTADEMPECFRTGAIPATFVIDRGGRIVLRHFGAARWDDDSVVSFLRGLAAAPG